MFYARPEWRQVRNHIILRDGGCDLACKGMEIASRVIIHHINPLAEGDILSCSEKLFDPENLVCVSVQTHNYIHYGYYKKYEEVPERKQGDTKLW